MRVLAFARTVTADIQRLYKRWTKNPTLKVFCISNTEYLKHLKGFHVDDAEKAPRLELLATGVPNLQAYFHSLPATGRFSTLEYHLTSNWEALLHSLEIFCNESGMQQKGKSGVSA
jgi:hypothetical protein